MYTKSEQRSYILSINCKKCNAELPDEASICLNCMTPVERQENDSTKLINTDMSVKERIRVYIADIAAKLSSLPKKHKAAILTTLVLLIMLIPLSAYLLSPVNATENTASLSGSEAVQEKPVSRIESFFDEVLGITESNEAKSSFSEQANASDNITNPESGTSTSSSMLESNTEGTANSTTNGNGSSSNLGSTSNSGSDNTTNAGNSGESENSGASDTNSEPVLNYDDWEYTISDSKVTVTKYTGNDKNIIVPDKFDGANLYKISKETFKDNSTLETVTFKDSEEYHAMTISRSVFNNCSSLKKVTFPKNTNLGISSEFALNCPKLFDIEIDFWQYRFVNGALYSSNGSTWSLIEYCEGYTASTYDVPSWCTFTSYASTNISNNKYLKTINIHENCYSISKQWNYYEYRYLENINVATDNSYYESINGVLYDKSGSSLKLKIYPAGKNDKTYNVPENCTINCYGMKKGLFDKIETIVLPASSIISSSTLEDILKYYPNLKTIKMEKGHSKFNSYKNTLDKLVNVVEY